MNDTTIQLQAILIRRRQLQEELAELELREHELAGLSTGQKKSKRANKSLEQYGFDGCARSTP